VPRTEQHLAPPRERRRLRIALVVTWPRSADSGLPHPTRHLVTHLERQGHEVLLISLGTVRGFSSRAASRRRLSRIFAYSRPDVVQVAARPSLGLLAAEEARAIGAPVLTVPVAAIDSVGDHERWPRSEGVAEGALHALSDRILVPSAAALDRLRTVGANRLSLWPRGVDTAGFHPDRASPVWRDRLAPAGEPLVGYVRRGARRTELRTPPELSGLVGVRLVAIGTNGSDALSAILASLDAFLDLSAHGDSGEGIVAALASGTPVVAPNSGEARDLVAHGRTGWLYVPGDMAEVKQRLWQCAQAPMLRAYMGERARAAALERDWSLISERLLDHYHDLVGVLGTALGSQFMTETPGPREPDAVRA
jgi:phosphatidylinositol alpha 1,6-mannosyltransferase